LIPNCDVAGKYHSNIFGLLIGIGMDVAFGFPEFGQKLLLPLAHTVIVGRDIAIVYQFVPRSHIATAKRSPKLVAYFGPCRQSEMKDGMRDYQDL
jgi:hypothetical protein